MNDEKLVEKWRKGNALLTRREAKPVGGKTRRIDDELRCTTADGIVYVLHAVRVRRGQTLV